MKGRSLPSLPGVKGAEIARVTLTPLRRASPVGVQDGELSISQRLRAAPLLVKSEWVTRHDWNADLVTS